MRKQHFFFLLLGLIMSLSATAQTQPSGSGTEADPFLLGSVDDMSWFRTYVAETNAAACAKLTTDFSMSSIKSWPGIGTENRPYQGIFDGDGHRITDLDLNYASLNYSNIGLFGVARYATIKNLSVKGVANVGALAGGAAAMYIAIVLGQGQGVTVSHITVTGSVMGYGYYKGGIVGALRSAPNTSADDAKNISHIENCENYATVNGVAYVGGIVGLVSANKNSTIERCTNRGMVSVTGKDAMCIAGGIAAKFQGTMLHCANYGKVVASYAVGGMVGETTTTAAPYNSSIIGCYNAANIVADAEGASYGLLVGKYSNAVYAPILTNNFVNGSIQYNVNEFKHDVAYCQTEVEGIEYVSTTSMADGRVAYLLQGDYDDEAWGQRLGTDAVPTLCTGAPVVYLTGSEVNCKGEPITNVHYANTRDAEVNVGHTFDENEICTACGESTPLVQDAEGYYLIANVNHYSEFRKLFQTQANGTNSTMNLRLVADIDLSGLDTRNHYMNYSQSGTKNITWGGVFDGQGHKLYNVQLSGSSGLLPKLNGGTVKDVHIYGKLVQAAYSGMVTNQLENGSQIIGCSAHGTISGTGNFVGGIVGRGGDGNNIVDRCVNYADITSTGTYVGGITGAHYNHTTKFTNCANYGTIKGSGYVGGLFGSCSSVNTEDASWLSAGDVIQTGTGTYYGAFAGDLGKVTLPFIRVTDPSITVTVNGVEQVLTSVKDVQNTTRQNISNGEAAFFLDNAQNGVWGQEIGVDPKPVLGGMEVFCSKEFYCSGEEKPVDRVYSNLEQGVRDPHTFNTAGICTVCSTLQAPEQDEDGCYLIYNAANLRWWGDMINHSLSSASARQMADIDLSPLCHPASSGVEAVSWEPIGAGSWTGVYDGNGYTITGLYINTTTNYAALFGMLGYNGDPRKSLGMCLKNLTVEGDVTVTTPTRGSGVCGASILCVHTIGGTIENCVSRGTVTSNDYTMGGILAGSKGATVIRNCTNYANINHNSSFDNTYGNVGGIVGSSSGAIMYCSNYGNVSGNGTAKTNYGGIAGTCSATDTYTDMYGNPYTLDDIEYGISYCANYGTIKGAVNVGGIAGRYRSILPMHSCINSYYVRYYETTSNTDNQKTVGGIVGVVDNSDVVFTDLYYINYVAYTQSPRIGTYQSSTVFRNGTLTYGLGAPWGQNITKEKPYDTYPVLFGPKVNKYGAFYTNASTDMNESGAVSVSDISSWVKTPVDFNGDGKANVSDLEYIINETLGK